MAGKRARWNKFGRFISTLVVVCFFMPFFGVSCDGMDVVTFSGADMVAGCKPGGLIADAADQKHGKSGGLDAKVEKVAIEPFAIAAMALAVAACALAWARRGQALPIVFGLAVACLGTLVGLYVKVGGELKEAVTAAQSEKHGGGMGGMAKDVKVDAGGRWGLWLVGLGLLGMAAMSGMAMREKEGAEPITPPSPPPPVAS